VATFIVRLEAAGAGPALAVKDLIDVAGVPTTAGSRPVSERAAPAPADAPCLAGARAAGARIVGKANLHELAFGASGVNEWFGTPLNPFDPGRVPGGSSSGSAVAVASGEADVAYGSDTGGSIRVPSAFCGTAGLKTTFGRVSCQGVWPLAPSLDTVGPMARDVTGLTLAMSLLEPGFVATAEPATEVARLRPEGVSPDPRIDAAVDDALRSAGLRVRELAVTGWRSVLRAGNSILLAEAAHSNRSLVAEPAARGQLGRQVADRLAEGASVPADRLAEARADQQHWADRLAGLFEEFQLLAVPTVPFYAPPLDEAARHHYTTCTLPFNLAGVPALALPVPSHGPAPASLQLVAPWGAEDLLLATGRLVEAAVGR
jgi:amidase